MTYKFNEKIQSQIGEIHSTIDELENNLHQSRSSERKAHLCFHMDNLKSKALSVQLDDAKQDSKHLLDILQNKNYDDSRSRSTELTNSVSTMSMVHLQYKYEELLNNHNGLLRMLEKKLTEIHTLTEDKAKLSEELEVYKFKLEELSENIEELNEKLALYRSDHKQKLEKLNLEKDTLRIAHNKLANLLHEECVKKNELLSNRIKETQVPERAQLLKEVQKNNLLIFENIQLRQENEYYRALLKLSMSKSCMKKRRKQQRMIISE